MLLQNPLDNTHIVEVISFCQKQKKSNLDINMLYEGASQYLPGKNDHPTFEVAYQ